MKQEIKEWLMPVIIMIFILLDITYIVTRFTALTETVALQQEMVEALQAENDQLRHEVVVLTDQKDAVLLELSMAEEENVALMEELGYLHYVLDDPMALFTDKLIELSPEDEELLMDIAMTEAGNQGVVGKALVMMTVLNRCEKSGDSIHDVIYAPNQYYVQGMGGHDEECELALLLVCAGWDGSRGAIYFCNQGYNDCASEHLFRYRDHYFGR